MDKVLKESIPRLIENGIFGNVKFISVSLDSFPLAPHFQSVTKFVKIVVENKENSKQEKISVVVKIQIAEEVIRKISNSSQQFSNESIMYHDLLPFIDAEAINLSPKCYYAYCSGGKAPDEDIIILDNLNLRGFRACKHKWSLDLRHIILSVNKLAEFHALSYIKKFEDKDSFLDIVKKLKRSVINENSEFSFGKLVYATMKRGVNDLRSKKPEHGEVLEKFLKLIKNVNLFYEVLFESEEPFSVVCHGDFLINNILYAYDNRGNVTDCRFFDFQSSFYTSPAIDLSLFLYMHTTQEIRRSHWSEILLLYWTTVREKVPSHIPLSSFNEFLRHFSERAVFAYAVCSFFATFMIADEKPPSVQTFQSLTFSEKMKVFLESGGEVGTKLISDIVLHLLEERYLHNFFHLLKVS